MLIEQKLGTLAEMAAAGRELDYLPLEWYETDKRILHRKTRAGRALQLRFLQEDPQLRHDDVIYADEMSLVAIEILPAAALVIRPGSPYQVAALCYEIGNKHLPLFYEQEELLVPFDAPFFRVLQAAGYAPRQEQRRLQHRLKTTVLPHGPGGGSGESLFSRILQLTNPGHASA